MQCNRIFNFKNTLLAVSRSITLMRERGMWNAQPTGTCPDGKSSKFILPPPDIHTATVARQQFYTSKESENSIDSAVPSPSLI